MQGYDSPPDRLPHRQHIDLHVHGLENVSGQGKIISLLEAILAQVTKMAGEAEALVAAVDEIEVVGDAIVAALVKIADQLKANVASATELSQLKTLITEQANQLVAKKVVIKDAIVANTEVAPE